MSEEARTDCPSSDFLSGNPEGNCWGDGHFMCSYCKHYRKDFSENGQKYIDAVHKSQIGFSGIISSELTSKKNNRWWFLFYLQSFSGL